VKKSIQILLAILTGLLVSISFPVYLFGWKMPNCGWVIWIALIPLFIAIRGGSSKRVYLLTLLSSAIWYLSSFFWVVHAMYVHGGMSLGLGILVLILMVLLESSIISLAPYIAVKIKRGWRGELIIWIPVAWVAMAFVRGHFPFGGFQWSSLAMSQWEYLPFIQIADLLGVYGLIFLIVWVNYFLSDLIPFKRYRRRYIVPKAIVTAFLVMLTIAYGIWRIADIDRLTEGIEGIKVGMIQGNISQKDKWDKGSATRNLDVYRRATAKLALAPVDLIVWPEAAMPWYLKADMKRMEPYKIGIPKEMQGTLPYTFLGAVTNDADDNYYNSAVLFNAQGDVLNIYNKYHMVPFGEYIPYKDIFSFVNSIVMPAGSFTPGKGNDPISLGNFSFVPLICYEDIFPEISRRSVQNGANFLLNITNNAWFGKTSAPYQQLALSVFRAVENRRYLLRSTNTGISAIVSPTGKILLQSGLFVKATMVVNIGIMYLMSTYTKLGDWFAWACIAYAVLGVIMVMVLKYRRR
jgi:apolipoprotein N-acyltransferase